MVFYSKKAEFYSKFILDTLMKIAILYLSFISLMISR